MRVAAPTGGSPAGRRAARPARHRAATALDELLGRPSGRPSAALRASPGRTSSSASRQPPARPAGRAVLARRRHRGGAVRAWPRRSRPRPASRPAVWTPAGRGADADRRRTAGRIRRAPVAGGRATGSTAPSARPTGARRRPRARGAVREALVAASGCRASASPGRAESGRAAALERRCSRPRPSPRCAGWSRRRPGARPGAAHRRAWPRCPLLAELLDAAGFAAAVRVPAASPTSPPCSARSPLGPAGPRTAGAVAAPGLRPRRLPAPRPGGAAGAAGGSAALGGGAGRRPGCDGHGGRDARRGRRRARARRPGRSSSTATASTLPPGWEHTGGLPERRRVLLTRVAAPRRHRPHRGRAHPARLRRARRAGAGARPSCAPCSTRPSRRVPAAPATARTHVGRAGRHALPAAGRAAPSSTGSSCSTATPSCRVGCRHTPAGTAAVRAACAAVVGSVRRALTGRSHPQTVPPYRHGPPRPAATVDRRRHGSAGTQRGRGGMAGMADGFGATTEEMTRAAQHVAR